MYVSQFRITIDVAVHHGGHVDEKLVKRVVDQWLEGEADLDGTMANQLDVVDGNEGPVVNSRTVEVIREMELPDEEPDKGPPPEPRLPGETVEEYKGRKLVKLRKQLADLKEQLKAQGVDME